MSGILAEQKSLIADALAERGITDYAVDADGEWISVLVSIN